MSKIFNKMTDGSTMGEYLSHVDVIMDLIPGISTLNNLVNLITRAIFSLIKKIDPIFYRKNLSNNFFVKHIENKSVWLCVLTAIPFINLMTGGISFYVKYGYREPIRYYD